MSIFRTFALYKTAYYMEIIQKYKSTIILVIVIVILILVSVNANKLLEDFEALAIYLYGDENPSNKGQLFATLITGVGAMCVVCGLFLNNKKVNQQIRQVNEQVRQNNISVQNSNDKRFGEAIGYLNDDNEGIVIGGVYALYQLAKEDERYAPIITNIFYNYVNDNTDKQEKKSYQTILSLLFSKDNPFVFDDEIKLQGVKLIKKKLYFKSCKVKLFNCDIQNISFENCEYIRIDSSAVDSPSFNNCFAISILNCEVTNDMSIIGGDIKQILFLNSYIFYCSMLVQSIKSLSIQSCQLQRYISINTETMKLLNIGEVEKLESTSLIIANLTKPIASLNIDDATVLRVNLPMN